MIRFLLAIFATFVLLATFACDASITDASINRDAPANLNITRISNTALRTNWNYVTTGNDTVSYSVERELGDAFWETIVQKHESKFYTDNVNTLDTLVVAYRVRAFNHDENTYSPYSPVVAYFSSKTAPTDVTATQIEQSKVLVEWQKHSLGHDGFYIDRKIENGNWQSKYKNVDANTTSFVDDVEVFKVTSYRVYAYKNESFSSANTTSITPSLLAPTGALVTKPDTEKVKLSWDDNNAFEQGYYIDRKIGLDEWQNNYATTTTNETSFVDDVNIYSGTVYYRIRAFKDDFYSVASDTLNINIRLEKTGTFTTSGTALDAVNINWNCFIADNYQGLTVIDATDPSRPTELQYDIVIPDRTLAIEKLNNWIFTASYGGIENPDAGNISIIDASNTDFLILQNSIAVDYKINDMKILGDYLFTVSENGKMYSYLFNGNNLVLQNEADVLQSAYKIEIYENYAYVALHNNGFAIINISNPGNMNLTDVVSSNGSVNDFSVYSNKLYTAEGEAGIGVYNLNSLQNMQKIATIVNVGYAKGISNNSHQIFVASSDKGISVINPDTNKVFGKTLEENSYFAVSTFGSYILALKDEAIDFIIVKP